MRNLSHLCVVGVLAVASGRPCMAQRPPGPATLENLVGDSGASTQPRPPQERKTAPEKPSAAAPPASPAPAPAPPPKAPPPKAPPAPVPDKAAIKEARELVRQAYDDDYKADERNRGPLVDKLLAAARETKDPARKYAMLLEAEEAAAASGECRRVMEVIDAREEAFAIDGVQVRLETLSDLLTPAARKNPGLLARIFESAVETADRAAQRDALTQAKAAAALAERAAKAIAVAGKAQKNTGLAKDGEAKQEQARGLTKVFQRRSAFVADYKEALDTLKARPDDPEANGVVGSFLCFERGEWFKGLPLLAKGDRREIAEIAAAELRIFASSEPKAKDVFDLAGKWWAATESDAAAESGAAIKKHAGRLYESVWEQLEDPLDKAVAKKRMPIQKPTQKKWFLSDLPERDPVVGHGSFGKNGDLGFDGSGTRQVIVRGKQFHKALSTHAATGSNSNGKPSGVSYDVPEGARRLVGAVAINDSASKSGRGGAFGPVSIEILGDDGRVRWKSPGTLQRAGDAVDFSVPVDGAKRMRLVAIARGDGNWGHVVWLDPYFEAN